MNERSFAFEGWLKPLIFRTNCSEAARISSSVAGGSKLNRGRIFLHIPNTSECSRVYTESIIERLHSNRNTGQSTQLKNRVDNLTKIVVDDLDSDEVSSLVEYMTAMSSGQMVQHKKIIEVNGLTNKKIKFLLHKFLYTRHLVGYGVLDTAGNFEIVYLKPEEKHTEQHETLSPTMDVRLPVVIPHWVQPSDMIEWQGQRPPLKKIRYKKK